MPRYIDADKLTRMFIGNLTFVPQEFIDSAETVDAIPIDRLEQEIDRYIDLGLNSVAKELRTIIDEWRKENESNNNS